MYIPCTVLTRIIEISNMSVLSYKQKQNVQSAVYGYGHTVYCKHQGYNAWKVN